uniref:Uncharacterized protein n=1 Tax=Lutzomyia longipalpis TaxID=7200 RepID=A0A7G3B624_LUTLO
MIYCLNEIVVTLFNLDIVLMFYTFYTQKEKYSQNANFYVKLSLSFTNIHCYFPFLFHFLSFFFNKSSRLEGVNSYCGILQKKI